MKNSFGIGAIIFTAALFFSHAPFFMFIPVPRISMDTLSYYWFAQQICLGSLPVTNMPTDFPFGYPLFLWAHKVNGLNIQAVAFVQTLFFGAAGIWLIYHSSKALLHGGLIAGLGLTLYTIQPHTMNFNAVIYTESLYCSGLILLAGSAVWFFSRKGVLPFIFVVTSVLWVMLLRPNGVAMILIPVLMIATVFMDKKQKAYPYVVVLCVMLLVNMTGNYIFKDTFSFGDSKRISKVLDKFEKRYSKKNPTVSSDASKYDPNNQSATDLFYKYFMSITLPKPSLYYSMQPSVYRDVIVYKMPTDTSLSMFDGKVLAAEFAPGLREFIFDKFDYNKYASSDYARSIDYNHRPLNVWMYAVHLTYELYNKSKVVYLIYLAFWLFLLFAVYKRIFTEPEALNYWNTILTLGIIHLVPLLLLPFLHNRYQLRYIHVSEFIVFLIFFAGIFYVFSSAKGQSDHIKQ